MRVEIKGGRGVPALAGDGDSREEEWQDANNYLVLRCVMSHPTNIVLILYRMDEVKDKVEVKGVDVDGDVADEVDDGIIDIDVDRRQARRRGRR